MKKSIILLTLSLLLVWGCKTNKNQIEFVKITDSVSYNVLSDGQKIELQVTKGNEFNHPTFVIWQEDLQGNFLKTLFVTESYAKGVFGHQMVGDSMWLDKPGASYQPAALPYWTFKKGKINNNGYVPTTDNPYVDGYSGATPIGDFAFTTKTDNSNKKYIIYLEVNQTWDWNKYWTNNKFPDNDAYKHSAQPSIIYAVTINDQDSIYFLNPIGHGDPKGETGKLYTNLSTLTTAKNIFESIKITIEQ